MKEITGLYVILAAIFFVNLTNMTLFNNEDGSGIAMWLNTGLFCSWYCLFFIEAEISLRKINNDY